MFSVNQIQELEVWFILMLDRAILFAFEQTLQKDCKHMSVTKSFQDLHTFTLCEIAE